MHPPLLRIAVLALIVASTSCSGDGKPGQGDAADTAQLDAEETSPATDASSPDFAIEPAKPAEANEQVEPTEQPEQNPVNQRPTDVTLIVGGDPRYAGTYSASQLSQICGELRPEESMTGERAFVVEFPADTTPEISGISFGSSKLVSGVTTTDQFRLNFNTNAKPGGAPARFAIDTVPPVQRYMGQGTATLNAEAHTDTLKVVGANEAGEAFDLTLVCKPRQD